MSIRGGGMLWGALGLVQLGMWRQAVQCFLVVIADVQVGAVRFIWEAQVAKCHGFFSLARNVEICVSEARWMRVVFVLIVRLGARGEVRIFI